jgi:hypothetical protein
MNVLWTLGEYAASYADAKPSAMLRLKLSQAGNKPIKAPARTKPPTKSPSAVPKRTGISNPSCAWAQ